ncbi:germin-like protein 1-1 [Selaginella moellendorffii]|uniref:germin-like protein 1-1 n=1 Tax=Selaginella moellendorffii TaxID=88036 RepID=UPI000D1C7F1B|nr:germin-like protein 1-1 [Selaginella moellendorffii]|eukprot:XP_024536882.1 germin-like protein 1-1 [Selaginella moellendorffii]
MISLFAASLLLLLLLANAADPDPLQDHCVADLDSEIQVNGFPCKPSENTTASDFKFSRLANRGNTNNELGLWITRASVEEFPGVNTMGLSSARADYAAKYGMNPPHVHPRASETFYLFEGDLMYVGFVDTDYKLYATYLTCGDLFVFPRGLVHFQLNVGRNPASAFVSFNSQRPGLLHVNRGLFATDPPVLDEVLTRSFAISEEMLKIMRGEIEEQFEGTNID